VWSVAFSRDLTSLVQAVLPDPQPSCRFAVYREKRSCPVSPLAASAIGRVLRPGPVVVDTRGVAVPLDSKLPQMMIQMLVHQDRPLLRRQSPKEAVRVRRAALGPGGYKPVDHTVQTCAFLCQVPIILDH